MTGGKRVNVADLDEKFTVMIHMVIFVRTHAFVVCTHQPTHMHSLVSSFVIYCLESVIAIHAVSKISRFYLVSVALQIPSSNTL